MDIHALQQIVHKTRDARRQQTIPKFAPAERDQLIHKYHPDFRASAYRSMAKMRVVAPKMPSR